MEYVKLLVENGLIESEPTFVIPSGYIGILFFAPIDEFKKYIQENVK